jgi:hypothetical protein
MLMALGYSAVASGEEAVSYLAQNQAPSGHA